MIRVAVLTLSDRGFRGEREDLSGQEIRNIVAKIEADIVSHDILPDEKDVITGKLIDLCGKADLILTTGGTGLSPRDVTPEATREVIQREIPGIAEAMRLEGLKKTSYSMLSRAVAGVRNETLIINLPGSPRAVRENLKAVIECLPHAIEKIRGSDADCAPPGSKGEKRA
jgi:molybdenum cofactor synthesis domain-containing protein